MYISPQGWVRGILAILANLKARGLQHTEHYRYERENLKRARLEQARHEQRER